MEDKVTITCVDSSRPATSRRVLARDTIARNATRGQTDERSCSDSKGDQEVTGQATLVHADEYISSQGATSDAFRNSAVLEITSST